MRAQFLVAAVGILSARYIPPFEGIDSFKGESYHTSRWPKEKVDFTGKRVAVIGTGATAVQLIPIIAKEVAHLTVFQRTPNYCAPLRNSLVTEETQRRFKATYAEIHKRCLETPAGFPVRFRPPQCPGSFQGGAAQALRGVVGTSRVSRNGWAISATS